MWALNISCCVEIPESPQQLVEFGAAIPALVIDACAARKILDHSGPEVLPRCPKLHFNTPPSVSGVDVHGPVTGIARMLHIVDHPIAGAVAPLAVSGEAALDSLDCIQRRQHRTAAADVLHSRELHRGLSAQLVPYRVTPLETLRNLGVPTDRVALSRNARLQAHTSCQHRQAVRCPERLHGSGGIVHFIRARCRRRPSDVCAQHQPCAIDATIRERRRRDHRRRGYALCAADGDPLVGPVVMGVGLSGCLRIVKGVTRRRGRCRRPGGSGRRWCARTPGRTSGQ